MEKDLLLNYIKKHTLATLSTISKEGKPEAALVGIAVTRNLEIIFDTVKTSRKYGNILQNPNVALVIGWDNETTIQYEGVAKELSAADDEAYKEIYYQIFPEGRQRAESWPGLVHFIITPRWIRYSNFNEPQIIEELSF